jgi:hypothetical protein
MENRALVYTARKEYRAILIKDKLSSSGIDAIILNHKDSISNLVGDFEVYVNNEDLEKAKEIVGPKEEE